MLILFSLFIVGCSAQPTTSDPPTDSPAQTAQPLITETNIPIKSPTKPPTQSPTPEPQLWEKKANMPTARWGLSTSVVNGKIYAIGGIGGLTAVEEYDPVTDTWTKKADMPTGRGFISTCVIDGKIYAIGGNTSMYGASLATVEIYNPSTDSWTSKADMTTPRDWLATNVVDGKIYAMGGDFLTGEDTNHTPMRSVEMYDPETNQWAPVADMRRTRRAFGSVVIDDKLYAIGSFSPYEELYDPGTDTWEKISPMPKPRMGATVSVVDGKIYVFGGEDEIQGPPTSVVYEYDPATDTWATLADMPFEAFYMSSSVVDGKIYVIGGSANVYPHLDPHLSTVWEYIPQP